MTIQDILDEEKEEILDYLNEDRSGSNNPNYKGSIKNLSRRGWHYRVFSVKGKASDYPCRHCGKRCEPGKEQSYQWAFTGEDRSATPTKISQFIPLCKSCHSKKDQKHTNFSKKTDK